jgi:hypothetical protein
MNRLEELVLEALNKYSEKTGKDTVDQWFPNGVSGGSTRCVARVHEVCREIKKNI